jgi:CO/xanthine dehydrogenase FAD-binding subunit
MLAFDFDYYLPDTVKEAVDIFDSVKKEGKTPLYYGGGTEIISMGRVFNVKPDAVIDFKKIPECRGIGTDGTSVFLGAAATLNDIIESNLYPLLSLAAGRIADHTVQCKITLGGNLAGTIIYHETLPPLLLADGTIYLAGPSGTRQAPIIDVLNFNKGLRPGEIITKVSFDKRFASLPYIHVKKSKIEKIGYPLVTLFAVYDEGIINAAVSGMCDYPFRFKGIDIKNNDSATELAGQLAEQIAQPVLDDMGGSAGYRDFMFKKTLENAIIKLREQSGEKYA